MLSIHSVFAESLNVAQVKESVTQILTRHYYIAENTESLKISGECALFYRFAEVYAALLLCWAIPNINIMLR